MTPQDRDALRAEAAMRVLAAMYANARDPNYVPPPPRNATEAQLRVYKRGQDVRRMENALEAVTAADALIAELKVREEYHANDPDTIEGLVAAGVAAGGQIITCRHGRTSFEPCEKCDAEHEAGKSGEVATDGKS